MSRHGRRAAGWTTLVAGLGALAVGLVLLLRPPAPPPDAGTLPPVTAVASPEKPAGEPGGRTTGPGLWTPERLAIGALDLKAPVDPVGVTGDGALDVPDDPDRLGWWIGSALPGDRTGTVLIAGHVDTARDGPGALYRLESLRIGSRIDVRAGDRTVAYRVTARRSYAKTRLPQSLFRRDATAQLALVTCGGAFRDGTYDHNVVVYAAAG
jgi:sortase family protein